MKLYDILLKGNFLQGKKTYIGAIVLFLAAIGVPELLSPAEIEEGVSLFVKLFGLVAVVYGRVVANKKNSIG